MSPKGGDCEEEAAMKVLTKMSTCQFLWKYHSYFYFFYLSFISLFYNYIVLSISTYLSQPTYIPNYVYIHT